MFINKTTNMVRHFETKAKAKKFIEGERKKHKTGLRIYKKKKGHLNRVKKPFVVASEIQWLNLY